jgi:hypothetical protein
MSDDYDDGEEVRMIEEIDANNRNRSYKNILNKRKVSRYELDEIFLS